MLNILKKLFRRKTVGYVSEMDRMLAEFKVTHYETASQLAEIKKYQHIYELRDKVTNQEKSRIWEEF